MRAHRAVGFAGLIGRLALAIVLLASLVGRSRRWRHQAGRVSGPIVATVILWVIGASLLGLGLLALLISIGHSFFANFGISLVFCLAPGAALAILGWVVYRDRQAARWPESSQDQPGAAAQDATSSSSRPAGYPAIRMEKAARKPAYYRERATAYRQRIHSIIKKRRPGPIADLLAAILSRLERWEERVGQLADRLTVFETDKIVQRDIKDVPRDIARLERQLLSETDPEMHRQIAGALDACRVHREQLEALVRLMRRTRYQLDDTLAAMGTIYSQVQVVDAMDIDSTRAAQISEEIQEQVDRLNDLLSAMTDVYRQRDEVSDTARRIRLERGGLAR